MDFHASVVAWHGEAGQLAVDAASIALAHARSRRYAVFHVVPAYRANYPELCAGGPFDAIKAAGLFRDAAASRGIAEKLVPQGDEPVVAKFRYSPFFANDLLRLLRMRRIDSVVFAGVATSGVVLSAVRDAGDLDYRITVLADGCADRDPEIHHMLLNRLFPTQATVVTASAWIKSA